MRTYATTAAHELVDEFQCRIVRQEELIAKTDNPITRAVHVAWRDATDRALRDIEAALADIEEQARLVPEQDYPDVMTEAQRVVDELFPSQAEQFREFFMAGDVRDFPADAA